MSSSRSARAPHAARSGREVVPGGAMLAQRGQLSGSTAAKGSAEVNAEPRFSPANAREWHGVKFSRRPTRPAEDLSEGKLGEGVRQCGEIPAYGAHYRYHAPHLLPAIRARQRSPIHVRPPASVPVSNSGKAWPGARWFVSYTGGWRGLSGCNYHGWQTGLPMRRWLRHTAVEVDRVARLEFEVVDADFQPKPLS